MYYIYDEACEANDKRLVNVLKFRTVQLDIRAELIWM